MIENSDEKLLYELEQVKNIFHEVLSEITILEKYFSFENLRKIERLDRLVELRELDKLNKLEELDKLKNLSELANLQIIDQLAELKELKNLDKLKKLDKLDNLGKLDKLLILSQLDLIPEMSEKLQFVVGKFELLKQLDSLDRLSLLNELDKLCSLEKLDNLKNLGKLDHLSSLDELEKLDNLSQLRLLSKLENLVNLSELDKLEKFYTALREYGHLLTRLEKLDSLIQLKELDSLHQLQNLVELRKLDNLFQLDKLDSLKYLEKLDGLNCLEKLDSLKELERLNSLDHLDALDNLYKLEKLDKLDKFDKVEKILNSPAWNKLDRLQILENKDRSLTRILFLHFIFDLLKIGLISIFVTFAILYSVSSSQMNSLLAYLNLNSSAGVSLSLPILSATSHKKRFEKIYSLAQRKILNDINTFWYSEVSDSNVGDLINKLDFIHKVSFKNTNHDLTTYARKVFNQHEQKAKDNLKLEFDNLIALEGKNQTLGVNIRRVYFSYTNQRCVDSWKLANKLSGSEIIRFKRLSLLLSLSCMYTQTKENINKLREIVGPL